MVTRGNSDLLFKDLLESTSTKKWDLVDTKKRDAWRLKTESVLRAEPEVWASVNNGRPTAALIKTKDPSLGKVALQSALVALEEEYDDANGRGFRILVERIDYTKRPALATRILHVISPRQDGHALWQLILEASSDESLGKQEAA